MPDGFRPSSGRAGAHAEAGQCSSEVWAFEGGISGSGKQRLCCGGEGLPDVGVARFEGLGRRWGYAVLPWGV